MLLLVGAAVLLGSAPTLAADAAAPRAERPLAELPYTPSLDLTAMDRSVDPCADLYTYSCGGWMKSHPIPADQSRWHVYGKLYVDNQQYLWGILEAAAKPDPGRTPNQQKIGDYFSSCMDEPAIARAGAAPLRPDLDAIDALGSVKGLPVLLGQLHLRAQTAGYFFGFFADQDPKNSEKVIAWATAGGLGLPDRDYYFQDDEKSVETRRKYVEHVGRMLRLIGESPEDAARDAGTVMRIETALAKASLTLVEQRDPYKIYHKMSVKSVQKLTPSFRWSEYLAAAGAANVSEVNVMEPAFFKEVEARLKTEKLADLKVYLKWALARDRARYLSSDFEQADFDFYRATLRGVKEMQPRWKRCVGWVDRDLGEALGEVFVQKTFSPDLKVRTLDMVQRIEKAMEVRIKGLPWMSASTKKQALAKLATMRNKIGYPDKWRDYTALEIKPGDFLGNITRATVFESRRILAKVGKPVDRGEWGMTPPTVNAYFNASMNDINFPAGILLPPLYDPRMDDAPNYGNTGATIGHELTHGFDDEGRQYDAKGNLNDWWTGADAKEFEKRASCIVDQYAQYTIVDDLKINSKLTLGEDVADLGGTILAYVAWKDATANQRLQPRDGLTPDQRFFVGYAQWTCENARDEDKRLNALTNPHSPGIYRINGVVANMPEFAEAFACKKGAPLVRDPVCRIW
jgi:endothelin-converting enzyme/putative endopeptidase